MRKVFKIIIYVVVGLVVIGALGAFAAQMLSDRKRQRTIDIKVEPLAYVSDDASLARGKHLFMSRGCAECHGENGGGHIVIDQGGMYIKSPNITNGSGSVVAKYTEADWVRINDRLRVTMSGWARRNDVTMCSAFGVTMGSA